MLDVGGVVEVEEEVVVKVCGLFDDEMCIEEDVLEVGE